MAINRRRGAADDARLLFQETIAEGVRFHNPRAVAGTLRDERDVALLLAALRMTTRWGGAKSRGLGWARVEATAFLDGKEFDRQCFEEQLRSWKV